MQLKVFQIKCKIQFFLTENALGDLDTSTTASINLTLKPNHVLDSELHKNSVVPTRFLIEVKE